MASHELEADLDHLRGEMRAGFQDVREEFRAGFKDVRAEIRALRTRVDTLLLAMIAVIATLAVKL